MARALTIIVTFLSAGLLAWMIPLIRLYGAIQPLIVAFSIMVAAVFVRLNRGMPTLEWKSLDPEKRRDLTASIVAVTEEYGWIIGINAAALAGLVTLSVIGVADAGTWKEEVSRTVSGAIGGLVALCASRIAYVVWRDIDIVRLQKRLIDGLADRESASEQIALADSKVLDIKSAKLRKMPIEPPRAWGE